MDTEQFVALCDSIQALSERPVVKHSAYEEEKVRIQTALTPNGTEGMSFAEFKRLQTGIIYLSIIDDAKDYGSYCYILDKISSHFNGSTQRIADWSQQVWKDVIAYVKTLPEYPKTEWLTNDFINTRERERAHAAKRLTPLGVTLSVRDCNLVVEQLDGVYVRIEQLLTEIGGEAALNLMLADMQYIKEFGRFLVPHQGNQPMPTFVELELPYGYLYNLCLKHLKDKGNDTDRAQKWEQLTELLKDYVTAVYNSQKFSIWDDIIYLKSEVVKVVHELILRFNIYNLPQSGASFVLAWCDFLIKEIIRDVRCESSVRENLKNVKRIMNWAFKVIQVDKCTHIKKGTKECRLLEDNKRGVESKLIVNADNLNKDFSSPADFAKVNSIRYPIIETADEYILLPKSLGAWSWYEAIYNIIRINKETALAKDIGHIIEVFLHNKMLTHGVIPYSGEYTYNGIDGEVDFVITGKQADAIIESKKKSLSLKAQAGDDYYVWGDLLEFIESQMQCVRLENGVKNFGPITLTDRNKSYVYKWHDTYIDEPGSDEAKQRHIVKVSMTLKEYGPMQDKVVVKEIIKSLINGKIDVVFDPIDTIHSAADKESINKTIDKINKSLEQITKYYKQIGVDKSLFYCRFYSMEQLFFMMRQAKDQNHFVKLLQGGFVSMGTENFWNEFYCSNINDYLM